MSENLNNMEINNEITERIRVDYDKHTILDIEDDKLIILTEINKKQRKKISIIYDNQEECALVIVYNLHNKKIINIMIVALTQSGKTGTMLGLIKNYLNEPDNTIPIENIYIITGLSSRDWVEQTTNRMPKSIQERVFHRDNLTNKFVDDIKNKKNVLIIIDEIQIAAKENQTLYKAFNDAGFYNKQNLLRNDINIIELTATPDGTIYDLMNWGENALKIKMEPGQGYTSCFDLKHQDRIKQYKDLFGCNIYSELEKIYYTNPNIDTEEHENNLNLISEFIKNQAINNIICNSEINITCVDIFINENGLENYDNIKKNIIDIYNQYKDAIKNIIEIKEYIYNFENTLYHIIRTPNGPKGDTVIDNFKLVFKNNTIYHTYDEKSNIEDINNVLKNRPEKHTFIFIKEKLRCAKTLYKKYLGIVYERYTKSPDDAVVIQGLVGRGTGYDDNGKSIYFTNISSIEKYEKLWESNFEDKSIKWNSKTTKRKNDLLHSTGTYNNPSLIDGMSVSSVETDEEHEPVIKKFTDFDEVKKYVKEDLGNKRGPNNPYKNINSDGFYECNVRGVKKVWNTNEMYIERKCNIKNGAGYGFRYCYEDVNDKSTLQFWIIHY